MSVDVYEDHIRFLGYHVPLDTSKLPPTAVAALVDELQSGVDRPENAGQNEIDEAVEVERERVLELVETLLSKIEDAVEDESLRDVRKHVEAMRKFIEDQS